MGLQMLCFVCVRDYKDLHLYSKLPIISPIVFPQTIFFEDWDEMIEQDNKKERKM